jgi:hypothetical protein
MPLLQSWAVAPPRAPPPEFLGAGCEEEKMDDALRTAKLANLVEIEGYGSADELMGDYPLLDKTGQRYYGWGDSLALQYAYSY